MCEMQLDIYDILNPQSLKPSLGLMNDLFQLFVCDFEIT